MGQPLVKLLHSHGDKVTAIARKLSKYAFFPDTIDFRKGDAYDDSFMEGILNETHFDAIIDFMWRSYDQFIKWFPKMCLATDHYIVLSTSGVYANSKEWISEDSPRYIDNPSTGDDASEYHIEKARIENYVLDSPYKNWTIVRPHMIFSENNLRLGVYYADIWLFRAMHGRTTVMPMDMLDCITSYDYAGDIASEFEAIIKNSKSFGQAYTLTTGNLTTAREVLDIYSQTCKKAGYLLKINLSNEHSEMH